MKNTSIKYTIPAYLKSHLMVILAFLLFSATFLTVYFLYNITLEPVLFSMELVVTMALIFGVIDFLKYHKMHKLLCVLMSCITTEVDKLPHAKSIIESDYQNLIKSLCKERINLILQTDKKQTEMEDYFTLWVHQIKTPISAMRLLLQEETNEQKEVLIQELFKIEQYVEMVLSYLRLDSMSADLILKEYSLSDLVRQAVKKYSIIFIHKKIVLNLEEIDCSVLTDEKWLVFVLEQILSNSLKYTNEGGGINIYMSKTAQKTLIIEDTGIGIRQEDIPRIFDKGFTGYNGRMDKKSTGIGLYLSKQVLNKLSHSITVVSEVGAGTKISIDLYSNSNGY